MTKGTLTMLVMVDLPEPCGCGSTKAMVSTMRIERVSDRVLLAEVVCKGCDAKSFIPDSVEEGARNLIGDEYYHPVWFLTEDGKLIYWKSEEGRRLRWRSLFGEFIGTE